MTERAQYEAKRPIPEEVDRPTSVEVFDMLSMPMPQEALSVDDSRGFSLTSIKAGFVLERLNEVFGLLGYGWRYAMGPHHIETAGGKEEVLVEVAVQWRMAKGEDDTYCPPVYWRKTTDPGTGQIVEGWQFPEKSLPAVWSEPIFATGGSNAKRKGSVPLTDARRAAVTNAITKAAARMGVGNEVFKGQDELAGNSAEGNKERRRQGAERRQSGQQHPPRAKVQNGFADLEAIQAGAQVHVGKLNVDAAQKPQDKIIEQLATKMGAMGLKMQPARLVHVLLGTGGFNQKGVIGVYNFLQEGHLNEANIELLNQVAFP